MKVKEWSTDIKNAIIERYKQGDGYKKISNGLNIARSTVRYIVQKWKKSSTTIPSKRCGRPMKINTRLRRKLVKEANTHPTTTLEELKSAAGQVGVEVHTSTISRLLHKSGLHGG